MFKEKNVCNMILSFIYNKNRLIKITQEYYTRYDPIKVSLKFQFIPKMYQTIK